jgi:hypothetical protein
MTLGIFLVTVFLAVIAIAVILAIWQLFASQRGKAALTRDETYQQLARRAAEAKRRATTDLADVKERVARIEKILEQ